MSVQSAHLIHPKYRPDIDGLRAIAVLSVVIFHAFPKLLRGGFIGVDVFFVISGFLISTIIMGSLERNTFSFIEFYIRRINRIFPALLLVLIAGLVFGWFALFADEYKQLGKHVAGGAGFISNFLFWSESGYFDAAAEVKPLLHLWSLGIEEQFYIVWPVLLWLTWNRRLNLLLITISLAVISFYINVRGVHQDAVAAFYSPLTRFWELLMGSILAYVKLQHQNTPLHPKSRLEVEIGKVFSHFFRKNKKQTFDDVQSLIGAFLLLVGALTVKERYFPGWWAIIPTLGAMLIIAAGSHAWFNRKVLSNRVLVWFGLISFPLYLWHWPLLSFAQIMQGEMPSVLTRVVAVLLAIIFAWLTYLWIERPLRFGKHSQLKTIVLLLLMGIVGGVGYVCFIKNGFEYRSEQIKVVDAKAQIHWSENFGHQDECGKVFHGGFCHIENMEKPPAVLLIGDSHSEALYPGLANALPAEFGNLLNWGGLGCLPFFNVASFKKGYQDECIDLMNSVLKFAVNTASVQLVVMVSRGPLYISGKGYHVGEDGEQRHDRVLASVEYPEELDFREVFKKSMKRTIQQLVQKNKEVIFVLDVPELGFNPDSCVDTPRPIKFISKHIISPCAVSKAKFYERNREYRALVYSVLKEFPTVKIFDAAAQLCDDQWCWAMKGGTMLYRDDDHLSIEGSDLIARQLIKEMGI